MKEWSKILLGKDTTDSLYNESFDIYMKNEKNALAFTIENIQLVKGNKLIITHYFDDAEKLMVKASKNKEIPDTMLAPVTRYKVGTIVSFPQFTVDSVFLITTKSYEEDKYYPLISERNCFWDIKKHIFYSAKFTTTDTRQNTVCFFKNYNWHNQIVFQQIFSDTTSFSFPQLTLNNSIFSSYHDKELYVSTGTNIYQLPSEKRILNFKEIAPKTFCIANFSKLGDKLWLIEYRTFKMRENGRETKLCVVRDNNIIKEIKFNDRSNYALFNNKGLTIRKKDDGYFFEEFDL